MESSTPTPTELLSLTALVPRRKPRPPNLTALLRELIAVLSPPEVFNYLFAADPVHLPPLLSPSLAANAMIFQQSTTRVEPPPPVFPDPTYTGSSTHHMAATMVLAPALTLPPLTTLGVGVMQGQQAHGRQLLPLSFCKSVTRCLNFRFLHNPTRPVTLFLYDAPEDDKIVIYLCSNASLTVLHSFTASFKRSILLAAIFNKGDTLSVEDLEHALICIFQDRNTRLCPFCEAANCTCAIPLTKPAHPHDFSHFKTYFLSYFGAYQGVATMVVPRSNQRRQRFDLLLGARSSMTTVLDVSVIDRLRDWALVNHLRDASQNPLESVAFGRAPALALEDVSAEWIEDEPEEEPEGDPFGTRCEPSDGVSTHLAELLADVEGDVPVSMTSSQQMHEEEALEPCLSQPASALQPGPYVDGSIGDGEEQEWHADTSTIDTESEHRQDATWWGRRSRERSPRSSQYTDVSSDIYMAQGIAPEAAVEAEGMNGMQGVVANGMSVSVAEKRAAEAGGSEDVHEILRKMKDEERKERNRVSARRSNRKKKERGDALEAELTRVRGVAEDLRAQELRLREENRLLRGAFQTAEPE